LAVQLKKVQMVRRHMWVVGLKDAERLENVVAMSDLLHVLSR
jgi:hypothetical protein